MVSFTLASAVALLAVGASARSLERQLLAPMMQDCCCSSDGKTCLPASASKTNGMCASTVPMAKMCSDADLGYTGAGKTPMMNGGMMTPMMTPMMPAGGAMPNAGMTPAAPMMPMAGGAMPMANGAMPTANGAGMNGQPMANGAMPMANGAGMMNGAMGPMMPRPMAGSPMMMPMSNAGAPMMPRPMAGAPMMMPMPNAGAMTPMMMPMPNAGMMNNGAMGPMAMPRPMPNAAG